jgi:ATP-dependent DNA helicase DinG
MAGAVEAALERATILLCEAGTGTGKTLAYLLPAALSRQRVIVSTATKALEDQIFHRELPLIERALGRPVKARVAKGLGNYVCKRRLAEADTLLRRGAPEVRAASRSLPIVRAWAELSPSGDRAHAPSIAENDPVWGLVLASRDARIGAGCPHFEECFVTRLKQDLASAELVIVNHHLFFADLALKARAGPAAGRVGILPPYDAVLFDEAHRIEDVASLFFGTSVSGARIRDYLADVERAGTMDGLGSLTGLARDVLERYRALVVVVGDHAPRDGRALLDAEVVEGPLRLSAELLADGLLALENHLETHAVSHRIDALVRRARELVADLEELVHPRAGSVVTAERSGNDVVVATRAVDVGPLLASHLHGRVGGLVFTSATLRAHASGGPREKTRPRGVEAPAHEPSPFAFFRTRIGLDLVHDVEIRELVVESPFDFERQALFYVPRDLPPSSAEEFADRAVDRVRDLVLASNGGALILTTSIRMMQTLGRGLARAQPLPVAVQGDASKSELLAEFRGRDDAILVATMGFWEGVDVPGRALRLVVLDKLPFAVPTDALVQARARRLEHEGKDPFSAYSVPEALISLRQGFGRLIRTETDFGVVALLDRRLLEKGYGRRMQKHLPKSPMTHDLEVVRAFFRERG